MPRCTPLRAVLRHHSGNAAEKRRRGRHGADQQHGRAGVVLRFVVRRLSEWRHRQPAASYMFMAIALVVAVVLTLIVKPARNEIQPQLA
ncbi:hypothetical protein M8494_32760 [Serratia ureilytica]